MIAAARAPLTAPAARLFLCRHTGAGLENDNNEPVMLARYRADSPRLAMRWLSHRARRLAEQLDPPGPWLGEEATTIVPMADPNAPDDLRRWSHDLAAHERVMLQLADGRPFRLDVVDDDTRFTLAVDAFPPHWPHCTCR